MTRRLKQNETLHGTRHGQLPVDADLQATYELTDRESAVAALLALGLTLPRIAERLHISRSTGEKHLASLRRKLGVSTTTEAAAAVARFSLEQAAGIPKWPLLPSHDRRLLSGSDQELAAHLDETNDVDSAVAALRAHLEPEGVAAMYFVFLPMNVVSFGRADVVESWDAPARLVESYRQDGGLVTSPLALRIFAEPDQEILVDASDPSHIAAESGLRIPPALLATCRAEGLSLCIAFGAPFGCGFVGTSMFFRDSARDRLRANLREEVTRLRSALMLTASSIFARGILARTAALTRRERNALSLVAQGHTLQSGAAKLGGSPRAFAQLLKNGRTKLGAATNAEAIARAMALNALVFL